MESKRIPLKGIVRNFSSQLSEDGEMIDVINLRNKYGKLQPIKDAEKVYQSQYPIVYIHKNLDYENWISYDDNTGNLYWEAKKENGIINLVNQQIQNIGNIKNIINLANFLVITTGSETYYILYSNNQYKKFDIPDVKFDFKITEQDVVSTGDYTFLSYYKPDNYILNKKDYESLYDTINGNKNRVKDEIGKGCFTDPFIVICAIRLFDGSYGYISYPQLIFPPFEIQIGSNLSGWYYRNKSFITNTYKINTSAEDIPHIEISLNQNIQNFSVQYFIDNASDIIEAKDIITSVDIFVSKEIDFVNKNIVYIKNSQTEYLTMASYDINKLQDLIGQESQFYLMNRIEVNDIMQYVPSLETPHLLTRIDYSEETLSADYSYHKNIPDVLFTYNQKLHIANIKNILFNGFLEEFFISGQQNYLNGITIPDYALANFIIYTYIKTDSGISIVKQSVEGTIYSSLFPLYIYPDSRAYNIELYFIVANLDTQSFDVYKENIPLKPNDMFNFAYCVYNDGAQISPLYIKKGTPIATGLTSPDYDPEINISNTEISNSKIKVSSINNPFVFPPEQTYTVGSGDILGMASVTAALSQGQFGQFPLYVFTTEGIWALQVGTGEVAYTTANPVSRDVCNNPDSITPIDNAVIFTTEKGVNIISGSSVKSLSDDLDGETINISNESSVYFIQNLAEAIATIGLQSSFNDELFTDYIRTARLAYNYNEGEIYAINTSKNYYYCYSIANKEWSKRSGKFKGIIESYPNLYLQNDDNEIFKVNNENGNLKQWIFISRPVKLTGIQHKRIIRSFLRGLYNSTNSSKIAFSIFGSFDGESFELVNSVQGIAKNQRDILLGRSIRPYTYFIFAAYASSGTESEISAIDVMFEQVKRTLAI